MKPDPTINLEAFWTDRWLGSRAFFLPVEARGLYREMLTAAWRHGAELPTDHAQIRRLTMTTEAERDRCWPRIAHYWHVVGDKLVNFQQQRIYREAQARFAKASAAGQTAARRRWQGRS
jgi:uncharacterized protein YdaU (DUF1376 family)